MPIPASSLAATVSGSTVRFVDSISATAGVRLNVNDGASYRVKDQGANFDPPAMRRAAAETFMRDGAAISGSVLDNRTITLPIIIQGSTVDDASAKLRALMVELNRDRNILEVKWGTTSLFFRTYRSLDVQVDTTDAALGRFVVTCPILADPTAYGARADAAPVTVKLDATQTNGMYLDVTGVTGDVETPAYIRFAGGPGNRCDWILAARRRGTPASAPFVVQAETLTMSADTAAFADGVEATGAGSNTARTDFTSLATMSGRLTGTITGTADARGTYRMYVRVRSSSATGNKGILTFQAKYGTNSGSISLDVVTMADNNKYQMIDLGLIQMPPGNATQNGYSGVDYVPEDVYFTVAAARASGANTVIFDEVFFIAADSDQCPFSCVTSSYDFVLDGPNDAEYNLTVGTNRPVLGGAPGLPSRQGLVPSLTPGQTNRLYVVPASDGSIWHPNGTITVTVSHWPRFMVV